jgi:hypothetical protein
VLGRGSGPLGGAGVCVGTGVGVGEDPRVWPFVGPCLALGWPFAGPFARMFGVVPFRIGPILALGWPLVGPWLALRVAAELVHGHREGRVLPFVRVCQEQANPLVRPAPARHEERARGERALEHAYFDRVPPQVHARGMARPLTSDGASDAGPPLVTAGVEGLVHARAPTGSTRTSTPGPSPTAAYTWLVSPAATWLSSLQSFHPRVRSVPSASSISFRTLEPSVAGTA